MQKISYAEIVMPVTLLRLCILLFIMGVCFVSAPQAAEKTSQAGQPLFVGITPDFPPLAFKQNDKLAGVEVELALLTGKELDRPVKFIQLQWDEQISALLEGYTDIIMSSMTATRERQVRIAFSEPYMKGGIVLFYL